MAEIDAEPPAPEAAEAASQLRVPEDPRGGNVLRLLNFERRWLRLIFETLVPSKADPRMDLGAADVPIGRFIDDLCDNAPPQFLLGLRACLWFTLLCPVFYGGRLCSFRGLAPGERLSLFHQLQESDVYLIREMPLLFKTVACLGFCGVPVVQARLGITPRDATPPAWARADQEAPE